MVKIDRVIARQVFDSRGRPTVEADVILSDGTMGRASVPSGASTGTLEAFELRDCDADLHRGLGVLKAVENINGEICVRLKGSDALDQREIDEFLVQIDGTKNLQRLGANAVLGVSLALSRASASYLNMPLYARIAELVGSDAMSLPVPMVNILSGGLHADHSMDLQDFLFVPAKSKSFREALDQIARVRAAADAVARDESFSTLLADEGGLSASVENPKDGLDLMMRIFERAGLRPFEDAMIAIDAAASSLQTADGKYFFPRENRYYTSDEIIQMVTSWTEGYPVVSIEDALGESDWANWTALNVAVGDHVQIVGDDLFTTNLERVKKGIGRNAANAVLIKLNQNGTLTGTLDVIKKAKENSMATVVSARSGETEDSFIADLAVGANAGQIKIGSFRNSERLSKYNQLLRIEEESNRPHRTVKLPWEY
jgi:enolase